MLTCLFENYEFKIVKVFNLFGFKYTHEPVPVFSPFSLFLILVPFIDSREYFLFPSLVHVYKYIDDHVTVIYLTKSRIINHHTILMFVYII